MIDVTRDVRQSFFWSTKDRDRPTTTTTFVLNGVRFGFTYGDAALMYELMRGGISDIATLTMLAGVSPSELNRKRADEMFVWFDDEMAKYKMGRRSLPPVHSRQRVYCQECGSKLDQVPCHCGSPAHYDTSEPKSGRFIAKCFNEGDRHWNSAHLAIARSEATYHGSSYRG